MTAHRSRRATTRKFSVRPAQWQPTTVGNGDHPQEVSTAKETNRGSLTAVIILRSGDYPVLPGNTVFQALLRAVLTMIKPMTQCLDIEFMPGSL
jgi:hypothetical protein